MSDLIDEAHREAARGEVGVGAALLVQSLAGYQESGEPWASEAVTVMARALSRYRERYAPPPVEDGWRRVGKRWGHLQLAVASVPEADPAWLPRLLLVAEDR